MIIVADSLSLENLNYSEDHLKIRDCVWMLLWYY